MKRLLLSFTTLQEDSPAGTLFEGVTFGIHTNTHPNRVTITPWGDFQTGWVYKLRPDLDSDVLIDLDQTVRDVPIGPSGQLELCAWMETSSEERKFKIIETKTLSFDIFWSFRTCVKDKWLFDIDYKSGLNRWHITPCDLPTSPSNVFFQATNSSSDDGWTLITYPFTVITAPIPMYMRVRMCEYLSTVTKDPASSSCVDPMPSSPIADTPKSLFERLLLDKTTHDITFSFKNDTRTLSAHKLIMAEASPMMRAKFGMSHKHMECSTNSKKKYGVGLADSLDKNMELTCSFEQWASILGFIYFQRKITRQVLGNGEALVDVADYYQLGDVLTHCQERIIKRVSAKTLKRYLLMAKRYESTMPKLQQECERVMAKMNGVDVYKILNEIHTEKRSVQILNEIHAEKRSLQESSKKTIEPSDLEPKTIITSLEPQELDDGVHTQSVKKRKNCE